MTKLTGMLELKFKTSPPNSTNQSSIQMAANKFSVAKAMMKINKGGIMTAGRMAAPV